MRASVSRPFLQGKYQCFYNSPNDKKSPISSGITPVNEHVAIFKTAEMKSTPQVRAMGITGFNYGPPLTKILHLSKGRRREFNEEGISTQIELAYKNIRQLVEANETKRQASTAKSNWFVTYVILVR